MKVYQYFSMFICAVIFHFIVFLFTQNYFLSVFLGFISFFVFIWLKKKIIKHDINVELDHINEYYERTD